jgi:metal-responsive CopG/Arc/MetJ family transcriptional regulator
LLKENEPRIDKRKDCRGRSELIEEITREAMYVLT